MNKIKVLLIFIIFFKNYTISKNYYPIKDLVNMGIHKKINLIGFGLVIGLNATGDSPSKDSITEQAALNMLTSLGMIKKKDDTIEAPLISQGSIASVIVTAEVSSFANIGDNIDIKVSVLKDAKSLKGGTLISTPLGISGLSDYYAYAQGTVKIGNLKDNIPTVGFIINGAKIVKNINMSFIKENKFVLNLKNHDIDTGYNIKNKINEHFRGFFAKVKDPGSIIVEIPKNYKNNKIKFISTIRYLNVEMKQKPIIVVNTKENIIAISESVEILAPVSISYNDLSIEIYNKKNLIPLKGKAKLGELIDIINELGASTQDIISILQTISLSGALKADIKVL